MNRNCGPVIPLACLLACAPFLLVSPLMAAEPAWKEAAVPDDWKKAPAGDKGRLWYRTKLVVPPAWRERSLELVVESIDDAREIYLNGQLVGRLGEFPPEFRSALGETQRFKIPAEVMQFGGENV